MVRKSYVFIGIVAVLGLIAGIVGKMQNNVSMTEIGFATFYITVFCFILWQCRRFALHWQVAIAMLMSVLVFGLFKFWGGPLGINPSSFAPLGTIFYASFTYGNRSFDYVFDHSWGCRDW